MTKITGRATTEPVGIEVREGILRFPFQDDFCSQLDANVRQGAQRMLQAALEAEVDAFLDEHHQRRDSSGRRLVVRNGYLPSLEVVTGVGPLEIRQPRARNTSESPGECVAFLPRIIPAFLRRSRSIEKFVPWLYLKGIATNDFSEALAALLGLEVAGLSRNVIVRLK